MGYIGVITHLLTSWDIQVHPPFSLQQRTPKAPRSGPSLRRQSYGQFGVGCLVSHFPPINEPHRIHGTGLFRYLHLKDDFLMIHVGKYTSPMDPIWDHQSGKIQHPLENQGFFLATSRPLFGCFVFFLEDLAPPPFTENPMKNL